ncbi:hypothetical protein VTO42DRAFT_7573 [Malbranchea cinnamomea]
MITTHENAAVSLALHCSQDHRISASGKSAQNQLGYRSMGFRCRVFNQPIAINTVGNNIRISMTAFPPFPLPPSSLSLFFQLRRPLTRWHLETSRLTMSAGRTSPWMEAHDALSADENPRSPRVRRMSSRNPWTSDEVDYVKQLWVVKKRPMSEVVSEFCQRFSGRSRGAVKIFFVTRDCESMGDRSSICT